MYTPDTTRAAEALIAEAYDGPKYTTPLRIYVAVSPTALDVALVPVPDFQRPKLRGDLDNYEKLVQDALNDVAYDDDAQIVGINAWFRQ